MYRAGNWLFAAILVLIVATTVVIRRGSDGTATAAIPFPINDNAVHISIANSSAKEVWLHQAVDAFNNASRGDRRLG